MQEDMNQRTRQRFPIYSLIQDNIDQFLDKKSNILIKSSDFSAKQPQFSKPKTICIADNELWVGYGYPKYRWGVGVSRYTLDGNVIAHYQDGDMERATVCAILYFDKKIYAATYDGMKVFSFQHEDWVKPDIDIDPKWSTTQILLKDNALYFGSDLGIAIYDLDTDDTNYKPCKNYDLTDFCVDQQNNIWLIYDSSDNDRLIRLVMNRVIEATGNIPVYPQRILKFANDYIAIAAWGELALLQAFPIKHLRSIRTSNTVGAITRALAAIETSRFHLLFCGAGNDLKMICLIKDLEQFDRRYNLSDEQMKRFPWVLGPEAYFDIPLSQDTGMIYDLKVDERQRLYIASDVIQTLDLRGFIGGLV